MSWCVPEVGERLARERWQAVLRRSYDRSAAGYDERFAAVQREKYAAVLGSGDEELGRALARGRVLDLGCGTGLLVEFARGLGLPTNGWVGLDGAGVMLAHARRRRIAAVQGDVERLPFPDEAFAVVLAFTVLRLGHATDGPALSEIARVLAPGGRLAVTVLADQHDASFVTALGTAGLEPGCARRCGQDIGHVCRKT